MVPAGLNLIPYLLPVGWGLQAVVRFPVAWGRRCSPSTVPARGNRRGNQNVDTNVACQQQYGASARSHYRDYSEPFVLVLLHPVI